MLHTTRLNSRLSVKSFKVSSVPFILILYFPRACVGLLVYQDTTLVEELKVMKLVDADDPIGGETLIE